MQFIGELRDSDQINSVYLIKSKQALTSSQGKNYFRLTLRDKTGEITANIWDPDSPAIEEFDEEDYVHCTGSTLLYNGKMQMKITRARVAAQDEYIKSDYVMASDKNIDDMYESLVGLIASIKAPYYRELLESFYVNDTVLAEKFKDHSAAKSVHHSFLGGLIEHTVSIAKICDFLAAHYDGVNRDLLITAALFHDIGKLDELTKNPTNDYTDEGQLLGHIVIGAHIIQSRIETMDDFPEIKARELIHCIVAHHGKLEFGSPKAPALLESLILSFVDNMDAKVETMKEDLKKAKEDDLGWIGFNKFLETNVRRTSKME